MTFATTANDQQDNGASPGISGSDPRLWVERYADQLYAYAFVRLNHEEQALDLVQETFLAALEKLSGFRGDSSEQTWLIAILKYKIIELYRKRNSGLRTQGMERELECEFFEKDNGHWKEIYSPRPMGIEHPDPMASKELAAILNKCLQKLPALWLAVFNMKHMDDAATETICKELKLTASNFWVIMHRAKLNLRACIQRSW